MKNQTRLYFVIAALLLLMVVLSSCGNSTSNDSAATTTVDGGSTSVFTWTENNSATVQTAATANFTTQYKTLKASNGGTLLFEINIDGTTPATYVLNGTNAIAYTKVTPYFIPTTGNVVITASTSTVISGTFQGTGNNGSGITAVAGIFTNISVVP